jgi:hypothetical protein
MTHIEFSGLREVLKMGELTPSYMTAKNRSIRGIFFDTPKIITNYKN